jgi:ABC-type bacteriocin/lantibiotic exporter with double-glycine peptidase domain
MLSVTGTTRYRVNLILDEATSAIDVAGKHEILQRLRRLDARPTIVMIARRGESRALCNRVLHLAEGRLVAERERHKARA